MVSSRRKSRLPASIQIELIRHFVAGSSARSAAEICGINRNSAILYFHKLRELIADKLAAALNRAASFLRGRLGREVELRYTPQLHFIADRSYDDATAIDRLLMDPRVRRDVEGE